MPSPSTTTPATDAPDATRKGSRLGAVGRLLRDDSPAVLTRGYGFGAHLWQRARKGARAVPFRLLGHDALLVRGAEAV